MDHSSWDCKSLSRHEFDRLVFEVNHETAFYHIEEFVFFVMFVPMELTVCTQMLSGKRSLR